MDGVGDQKCCDDEKDKPRPDLWTAWETKNAATMRRIKLSENPAYALAGSMTPQRTLIARAMIEAVMMGRRLNKIAAIVVIKIVKRCHTLSVIPNGGGVNHRVKANKIKANKGMNRVNDIRALFFNLIIALVTVIYT